MQVFKTVGHLFEWLKESQVLEFDSKPQRLGMWRILLQSLASEDFNPAHCRPEFARDSFFGGVVSHGIGVLARAEGQFVQLLPKFFDGPIEIIALGFKEIKYLSPLRLGEKFHYRFELTNPRFRKARLDVDCLVICEVLGPNARVVAEARWRPALVEHPAAAREYLHPKGYLRNILEVLVMGALQKAIVGMFSLVVACALVCGALVVIGIVDVSTLNTALSGINPGAP